MKEENKTRKLINALLGNPVQSQEIPKPEQVYRLQDMLQNLVQVPDWIWSRYAFSRDPLRAKLAEDQIDQLAQKAGECGKEQAQKLIAAAGTHLPCALSDQLGLSVDYPYQPQGDSYVLFAQFQAPDRISIFGHGLERAEGWMSDPQIRETLHDPNIRDILLGHELYHFIEEREKQNIFTMTEKISTFSLGPLKSQSKLRSLGEIAGMAFTKELNRLPYSPFVFDVFLIYGYTREAASELYREIIDLCDSLGVSFPKIESIANQ